LKYASLICSKDYLRVVHNSPKLEIHVCLSFPAPKIDTIVVKWQKRATWQLCGILPSRHKLLLLHKRIGWILHAHKGQLLITQLLSASLMAIAVTTSKEIKNFRAISEKNKWTNCNYIWYLGVSCHWGNILYFKSIPINWLWDLPYGCLRLWSKLKWKMVVLFSASVEWIRILWDFYT